MSTPHPASETARSEGHGSNAGDQAMRIVIDDMKCHSSLDTALMRQYSLERKFGEAG